MRGQFRSAVILAVLGAILWIAPAHAQAIPAGPEIAVGTPSLAGALVQIPVSALGPVADPYQGFNLHLRWDPAVFAFSSAAAGDAFGGGALCAAATTSLFDADGGGVVFACGATTADDADALLATISLTVVAPGCSAVHLVTYGGADGGDSLSGTTTVSAATHEPQSNTYADGTADDAGMTCTPEAPVRPAPTGTASYALGGLPAGNCIYDLDLDERIDIDDAIDSLAAFGAAPGDPTWNGAYDVDANDSIDISDTILELVAFGTEPLGCVPEYPYYPLDTWDGSLPGGYGWSQYYLNLGAMKYLGTPPCSWGFEPPTSGGVLNECTAVVDMERLADHLHAGRPGLSTQVFVGPNDCTDLVTQFTSETITDMAGILGAAIQAANQYSVDRHDGVVFYAEVDDEAYMFVNGFCGTSNRSYQFSHTDEFFRDYVYESVANGALNPYIGPAGAPQMTSQDEGQLSLDGGGIAIPQIYSFFNAEAIDPDTGLGCGTDPWVPVDGSWPYTIANGYEGIMSFILKGDRYTSFQADIRWTRCHGTSPGSEFDWTVPGGRG